MEEKVKDKKVIEEKEKYYKIVYSNYFFDDSCYKYRGEQLYFVTPSIDMSSLDTDTHEPLKSLIKTIESSPPKTEIIVTEESPEAFIPLVGDALKEFNSTENKKVTTFSGKEITKEQYEEYGIIMDLYNKVLYDE